MCTHTCAHIYNLITYWNYLNTELHKAKIFFKLLYVARCSMRAAVII